MITYDPEIVTLTDDGHYALPANNDRRYDFYEWRREFLPHIIDISTYSKTGQGYADFNTVREWCSANVTGVYSFSVTKVFFELEDDSLLFKLGYVKQS